MDYSQKDFNISVNFGWSELELDPRGHTSGTTPEAFRICPFVEYLSKYL